MLGKCAGCGLETGEPKRLYFVYDSRYFQIKKTGMICGDCCFNEIVDLYGRWRSVLFTGAGNQLRVNWSAFAKIENTDQWDEVTELLQALCVFSSSLRGGNWLIMNGALVLNPISQGIILYFTSREHLLGYAREMLADTAYDWRAVRIGETIPKSECLK